ncbi:MAG: DUF1552 domain-containing protein [Nevskiaceae bacterium]|jgi:hypothetical protein|nr:DUF1552 domain-containing protein [Nevskiaceae bacterium]
MNFITRKHISRRAVLRGAGVGIGLPLLDAMVPAATALAATAAKPNLRMGFVYFPHGAIMDRWTPTGSGKDFKLSPILEPLADYQQQMIVVSNLGNRPGESAAVHAIVPGTWLSCVHPRESQDPYGGVTIDQMAALKIGQDTPLPSLEVSTEAGGGGGVCDRAYGCSYSGTIAFRTPSTPLPMEYNPRNLFQRLFGRGDTVEERQALGDQYNSILDMVQSDVASMKRRLGAPDRVVLADYLDSVREVERRVQKMAQQDLSGLDLPPVPMGVAEQFPQQQMLMFDMIALAWQSNLTRIATMMMAAEVSNMTYNFVGVPDAFHPVSHHQSDGTKIEKLVKIQTFHSQQMAKFLKRLADTPDGDGSLLDHSLIVYGSNMSNSNAHNQYPLPTMVLGGANGLLKGGQHINPAERTPIANLWLTLMNRVGIEMESVGDSSGQFAEI